MYYKKLIKRKKLIKFWIFLGSNIKNVFKSNYQFLNILYNKNCFLNFETIIFNFKKILPLFINIVKMNSNLLFIGSKFVYSQTIYKKFFFSVIKRFINIKSGIFTNFFVTSYKLIDKLNFDSNPSCIFFFNLRRNNLILLESKKENIPSIGIASSNLNVSLLDYPIFVNSLYFYSTFFLSKFFFKLILLNK